MGICVCVCVCVRVRVWVMFALAPEEARRALRSAGQRRSDKALLRAKQRKKRTERLPPRLREARRPLSVGTWCSGLEAVIWALRSVGFAYRHVFSADILPEAQAALQKNFCPELLRGDVLTHSSRELASRGPVSTQATPASPSVRKA